MKEKPKEKKSKWRSLDTSSITRLISLGNLHLALTLKLSNDFLLENRLIFNELSTLQDLTFLKEKKDLWKDILLSSNNNNMNFLLQINKSLKRKIFVEYIVLENIIFNDQQKEFKDLIDFVTETHFVFLKETEVIPCNNNIELYLINNDEVKCFNLSESKNINYKSNSNSNNNSIPNNQSNGNQWKKKTNSEVVLEASQNQEDDAPSKEKRTELQQKDNARNNTEKDSELNLSNSPFNTIKDINFIDFDYIYIDLFDYINTELSLSVKLRDIKKLIEYLKIHCDIQLIVNYPDVSRFFITIDDLNSIDQILLLTDIYLFERKDAYKLMNEIHLITSKSKSIQELNKKKDINFFINEICFQCPLSFKLKIGVFMDDFNKVTLVQVAPNSQPIINEYDATIHPRINHYNMQTVEEYKNIISSSYMKYYAIYYGGMIGKLIQKEITDKRIYLSYLSGIVSVKKILELDRNGVDLPKEKQFYVVKLSIDSINRDIKNQILKQKESRFVLDCVNEKQSKLKFYNPLFDFHLSQFFNSGLYRKELKTKGLINSKGFIMYDSVYRELMGSAPKKSKKKEKYPTDGLIRLIKDIKVGEKVSNQEINTKEVIKQSNSPIERQLPRISSNFVKYTKFTSSKRHLPLLKNKNLVRTSSGKNSNSQSLQLKKSTGVSPILSEVAKRESEAISQ